MREKLMSLSRWAQERFIDPPSPATLRRWAQNGQIPAKRIGGNWYVKIDQEMLETGDPLVDKVLQAS